MPTLVRDPLASVALPALLLVGAALTGYLLRWLLLGRVSRLARRTDTGFDDLVLAAAAPHVPAWCVALAAPVAVRLGEVPARIVLLVDRAAAVAAILSASLVAARIAAGALDSYGQSAGSPAARTSLARYLVRAGVLGLGLLLVLSNLGISITPLLTALGVGSLAVALALQPTLTNIVAGFQLTAARGLRVGDFIRLDGGFQGVVEDIGWRAIRLRETAHNIVVVPNARVAEIAFTNFSQPDPEMELTLPVAVGYGSDLARVERVTLEVAREVAREVPGGVPGVEPLVRFHTFNASSIDFNLVCRVQQFTDRGPVTHELVKRLHARYRSEGIEIPFPQRVLHGRLALEPPPRPGAEG